MLHSTMWEDDRRAMLSKCGDTWLSPGNAPILVANEPIVCPICSTVICLKWNVTIEEMSISDYEVKHNVKIIQDTLPIEDTEEEIQNDMPM